MSTALRFLAPLNSTNVRFMFQTLLQRVALRTSAALQPALADALAERLFLTPPPARTSDALIDLSDGRAATLIDRGRRLATWQWGPDSAPAVVLAHGWGGRAAQMRHFVYPLRAAGLRVIAYDQPAHGSSEGRLSGLPDFAGALARVVEKSGHVSAVIAHSLAGPALGYAMANGLALESAVLVSPPSDLIGYSRRFARWYRMPEQLRSAMQAAIEERFGVRWTCFELERLAPHLGGRALVIHDVDDRQVAFHHGLRIARVWAGARMLRTRGLGHARILSDDRVVRAAADFVSGRSQVAERAAELLPSSLY
jgi:alpha-beta hydrolase superfamily lysophospholipase